jgi:preprotein translocase subunit SecG
MMGLIIVIHVIVCALMIVSILMQSSKGGGMAGVFGGGSVGGVFGGRGAASFLSKVTMWLGVLFAATSLSIALLSLRTTQQSKSMLQQVMEKEKTKTASPADMLPTVPSSEPAAPEKK